MDRGPIYALFTDGKSMLLATVKPAVSKLVQHLACLAGGPVILGVLASWRRL